MIVKLAEGDLKTKFGTFQETLYYDGQRETIALFQGDLRGKTGVLCRVHSSCIFGHYFNSTECDCQEQLDVSQQLIRRAGLGIIILLDQEGKGNGHFALLTSVAHKRRGEAQADAYEAVGFKKDARDFAPAGKVLKDLGVDSVVMLTNNPQKVSTLIEQGVEVESTREIKL
jgi:GTP cyclohydrolase II